MGNLNVNSVHLKFPNVILHRITFADFPQELSVSLVQAGLDQWCAFGIGVGIGIEPLRVIVDFHSVTEAKGPADVFDNRPRNIKFLMSEIFIALFDSDSDPHPDPVSRR